MLLAAEDAGQWDGGAVHGQQHSEIGAVRETDIMLTSNHFRLVSLGLVASVEAQVQENGIHLLCWVKVA